MNGVRSTFMRRGYLLTALSALLLLAASAGTAWAQASQVTDIAVRSIRVDDANAAGVVAEGTTSNVTVTLNKAVPVGDTVTATVGVTYANGNGEGTTGNAEAGEVVVATSVLIPGGSSYGSTPVIFGLDNDAVDESFLITVSELTIDSNTTPDSTVVNTNLPMSTPATGKIDDAQEQAYRFTANTPPVQIRENSAISFTLLAVPPRPTGEDVTLHLAAPRGYIIGGDGVIAANAGTGAPASTQLTAADAAGQPVTLQAPPNDQNRTDDVVTLTAHMGTAVRSTQVAMAEVTVLDIHQLPAADAITADALDNERRDLGTAIESVMEGDTAYVWVAVVDTTQDRVDNDEMFTVDVTGADPSQSLDYTITRPAGDRKTSGHARGTERVGPWVIEVHEDEDVGMEDLMLSLDVDGDATYDAANGGGSVSGSFSLSIEDNTEKKIWPLPEADAYPAITGAMDEAAGDDGLNPGESFTVMTSDLFGLAEGYTAAYAASVEGGAVSVSASGDSVTVNAVAVGDSKVTVTATAKMAASSFQAEQSVSNVASITFPVEVVAVPEPPEEDKNAIEAKPEDDAYPIITGAIDAGAGEEGLNPGESATIDAAELFTVMEGYTASYAADVDGDAASASVSSGSHVTIMADALGEAKVTITGTATAASSSFQAGQPAANVATITFAVMVVDKGLTIELHGPDNVMEGNLVEGSEYHLTVKANRVVREDTMVSFAQRGGAENAASADDYELNDVTMLAGSDSVRATLSVVEDMEADAGHAMGEQLIIYAMAGDAESDDLMFTIWDEAVPALPLIAQLLLALFLMAGGARMYRRRQS